MMFIHMENMISRRQYHFRPFRQNNGLQYIDHLRNTCHLYALAMFVKNIQCNTRYERIPHRILLIQESRICARFHIEPASPFIYNHTDFLIRVKPVHNRAVTVNQLFHIKRFFQRQIPSFLIEVRGASFILPSARMYIIMQ